jgi:hypothetical protein
LMLELALRSNITLVALLIGRGQLVKRRGISVAEEERPLGARCGQVSPDLFGGRRMGSAWLVENGFLRGTLSV